MLGSDAMTNPSGYMILSKKHTGPKHRFITFWRPDNAGYAWRLDWSGTYSEEDVIANPRYYDNGEATIAVPTAIVMAYAEDIDFDNHVAPYVERKHMRSLVAAAARARKQREALFRG